MRPFPLDSQPDHKSSSPISSQKWLRSDNITNAIFGRGASHAVIEGV